MKIKKYIYPIILSGICVATEFTPPPGLEDIATPSDQGIILRNAYGIEYPPGLIPGQDYEHGKPTYPAPGLEFLEYMTLLRHICRDLKRNPESMVRVSGQLEELQKMNLKEFSLAEAVDGNFFILYCLYNLYSSPEHKDQSSVRNIFDKMSIEDKGILHHAHSLLESLRSCKCANPIETLDTLIEASPAFGLTALDVVINSHIIDNSNNANISAEQRSDLAKKYAPQILSYLRERQKPESANPNEGNITSAYLKIIDLAIQSGNSVVETQFKDFLATISPGKILKRITDYVLKHPTEISTITNIMVDHGSKATRQEIDAQLNELRKWARTTRFRNKEQVQAMVGVHDLIKIIENKIKK